MLCWEKFLIEKLSVTIYEMEMFHAEGVSTSKNSEISSDAVRCHNSKDELVLPLLITFSHCVYIISGKPLHTMENFVSKSLFMVY